MNAAGAVLYPLGRVCNHAPGMRMGSAVLATFLATGLPAVTAGAGTNELREQAARLFGAIEPVGAEEVQAPRATLGRALFWDTRLSANGEIACASCHGAEDWGADARARSLDARGRRTARHSQSVFNVQAAEGGLRWIGDRASGAEQALGSITGSMGFESRDELVSRLHEYGYAGPFGAAFPEEDQAVTAENYARALQAYQETLRTPAAFDRWLAGEDEALDERQRRGLRRFMDAGCAGCHGGPLFGGGSLQRFGLLEDFRTATGSPTGDAGLMNATGQEGDRDRFRVQPLRNVARTPPYFHDASVPELGDAVAVMARVQLGRSFSADEVDDILRFLDALSGEVPAHYAPPD